MSQKPQVRAKNKRRLTRRLAKWRAAKEGSAQPQGTAPSAKPSEKKTG